MLKAILTVFSLPACARRSRMLVLARHGDAESSDTSSAAEAGSGVVSRGDVSRLGRLLNARGLVPDAIFASATVAAMQAANRVADASGSDAVARAEPALLAEHDARMRDVLGTLAETSRVVVVVAGGQVLSGCAEELTGSREYLPVGGVALIEISGGRGLFASAGPRARVVERWRPRSCRATSPRRSSGGSKWVAAAVGDSAIDVALRALEWRFDRVLEHASSLIEGSETDDVENVRRLRVATRRSQAAIRVHRNLLPRRTAATVRDSLRRLRRAASTVRDLDVALSCLGSRVLSPDLAPFVAAVGERRRWSRISLTRVLQRATRDAKLARAMTELQRRTRLRSTKDVPLDRPFHEWSELALEREVSRFFECLTTADGQTALADASTPDVSALHDLRLEAKKLRYAIEVLAAGTPRQVREIAYPAITEIQNRLGAMCDHALTIAVVRKHAGERAARYADSPLDRLVAIERELLDAERRAFQAWWNDERRELLRAALSQS